MDVALECFVAVDAKKPVVHPCVGGVHSRSLHQAFLDAPVVRIELKNEESLFHEVDVASHGGNRYAEGITVRNVHFLLPPLASIPLTIFSDVL